MTDRAKLQQILEDAGIALWRYYPRVGSTNDLALEWAQGSAPDGALVLADTQTAGRGRGDRHWVTQPGSALAMSLILRPHKSERENISHFTALAALGLIRALESLGLRAELKWPNDVLLNGKKTAGVLVEADWQGEDLEALVIGLGVNVTPASVPDPEDLRYPATSVENALGAPVDRWELLGQILREMLALREVITEDVFLEAWNRSLAFRGNWVWFRKAGADDQALRRVRILGVEATGELVYETAAGHKASALAGEIRIAYNDEED